MQNPEQPRQENPATVSEVKLRETYQLFREFAAQIAEYYDKGGNRPPENIRQLINNIGEQLATYEQRLAMAETFELAKALTQEIAATEQQIARHYAMFRRLRFSHEFDDLGRPIDPIKD